MKILALEKEHDGITAEDFARYAEDEARHVWRLYQNEIIREIYFRADEKSAVILLECKNMDEAKQLLSEFPFVKNGLIFFEMIPLAPYPGFERLFKKP